MLTVAKAMIVLSARVGGPIVHQQNSSEYFTDIINLMEHYSFLS